MEIRRLNVQLPPHLAGAKAYVLGDVRIIFSDNDQYEGPNGHRWRHVSMSCADRLPTYKEVFDVRKRLFPPNAEVLQVFPPTKEHVNNHAFCLHLWWNKDKRLTPRQMQWAVGIPGITGMERDTPPQSKTEGGET
jgi:hypothetical protein